MAIINTIGSGVPPRDKLPTLWLNGYLVIYRQTGDRQVNGYSKTVLNIIDNKYWMQIPTGNSDITGSSPVLNETSSFTPITSFSLLIPEITNPYDPPMYSPNTLTGTVYNIHFQAWERYELHYENNNNNYTYDYNTISIDHIIHTGTSNDSFGDEKENLLPETYTRTTPNSNMNGLFAYLQIV